MKTLRSYLSALRLIGTALLLLLATQLTFARAGGAGGGGDGGGSSSSSSSGGGSSYDGGSDYTPHSGGGGGGGGSPAIAIFVIAVVIIILAAQGKKQTQPGQEVNDDWQPAPAFELPEGLDNEKIKQAFLGIQQAWMKKDLKQVRRFISDGVYQRFTAQFAMMDKLDQVNLLSNIRINEIYAGQTSTDGNYRIVDVAVSFSLDDVFKSRTFPQFNESFTGDSATEYWTFIKRTDATAGNLYNTNNCPNCGAPFEYNLGEISRCSGCGTLTNNASYDWVLCEITQQADYTKNSNPAIENPEVLSLTTADPYFALQRIEDMASNVFMQVMQVLSGQNPERLKRFAAPATIQTILSHRPPEPYVFNRLYLNSARATSLLKNQQGITIDIEAKATFQRVQLSQPLTFIDAEPVTTDFTLSFTKAATAFKAPAKETVYSYECASCGAPFTDTTDNLCTYCGQPVVDENSTWVLSAISFPGQMPAYN